LEQSVESCPRHPRPRIQSLIAGRSVEDHRVDEFRVFIGNAHGIGSAQRASNNIRTAAGYFSNEIRNELYVKIGRKRGGSGFIGETKTQKVKSVDRKLLGEDVKVLPPHEARSPCADPMDEHQWRSGIGDA